jgi:hypothetical protein
VYKLEEITPEFLPLFWLLIPAHLRREHRVCIMTISITFIEALGLNKIKQLAFLVIKTNIVQIVFFFGRKMFFWRTNGMETFVRSISGNCTSQTRHDLLACH